MNEHRVGAVEPPPWKGRGAGGGSMPLLRTRRGWGCCEIFLGQEGVGVVVTMGSRVGGSPL